MELPLHEAKHIEVEFTNEIRQARQEQQYLEACQCIETTIQDFAKCSKTSSKGWQATPNTSSNPSAPRVVAAQPHMHHNKIYHNFPATT